MHAGIDLAAWETSGDVVFAQEWRSSMTERPELADDGPQQPTLSFWLPIVIAVALVAVAIAVVFAT